jgi:ABC-2 type transport system ATP-binding protein
MRRSHSTIELVHTVKGISTMSDIAISASGLTRYFGDTPVVRQIDFSIPRGIVVGLLGLNGTGKTTTLRMLMGLLAPTRGSSHVLGVNSQQLTAADRTRIGYTVEGHFVYPWMKVQECEQFQSQTFSHWNRRLFHDTIDRFGINATSRVSNLSRGQRAGVSLALTLSGSPEILILDDPALGLDPISRRSLNETLLEFVATGERTVLLSSHMLDDVERIADRVLIMVDGRIMVDCSIANLLARVSSWTVEFDDDRTSLGTIPGLIHARVVGRRWILAIADIDAETEAALTRLGGANLVRNESAFDEASMAYLSRARRGVSFYSPLSPSTH